MKYTCLLMTALIAFPILVSAQSKCDCFNRLYNLSSYYQDRNDTGNAISALKDAISFLDDNSLGYYSFGLGNLYGDYNMIDSAAAWYTKAVIGTGGGLDQVKHRYPNVYAAMDTVRVVKILANQKTGINLDLYDQFTSLHSMDQALRSYLFTRSEWYDTTASVSKLIRDIYYRADSSSFELVKSTLEKYGYPSFNKLGFSPEGFQTLVIHTTAYDNNGWGDYIFNKLSALNATCDYPEKSYLLFLMDWQKVRRGQKSNAGITGGHATIADINKADSIRFVYNYLRIKEKPGRGEPLPPEYKPRPYPANYFCLKKYQIK